MRPPRHLPLLAILALAGAAAAHPAAADDTLFGRSWPEVGGWNQAWGDEETLPRPAARAPAAVPAPPPAVAAAPVRPSPPVRVAAAAAPPPPAPAAQPAETERDVEQPVNVTADQITHDREMATIVAKGKVEIVQSGRTLSADTVSYNLKQDVMAASGNVVLTEPTGEVTFADYFELTGDFKNGAAREIRRIGADRSRMAAASATRVGGIRTDFDDAVYTACEPCKEHPERTPLWQAKAQRVTHDQESHREEFRDAWMELGGVPIAYVPYFSAPDPTVRRQSGLLTPTVGSGSSIGPNLVIPYYWVISDNEDLTFSPRFLLNRFGGTKTEPSDIGTASLQRMVLAGEHRWRGNYGETSTIGSITADESTGDLRGHINAEGKFDIDRNWRAGYTVQHQSDDTYNSVYGYRVPSDKPWLTSRPYVERFGQRGYAMMEGFVFQGLTETSDSFDQNPFVLPHAVFSHVGNPDDWGGTWSVDTDALSYTRLQGTKATRLSNQFGYHLPYTTQSGQNYTVSTMLRTDGYHGDEVAGIGSANIGRVVPQIAVNWNYPFVSDSRTLPQVISPLVMVAAGPNGGNSMRIPNEDSIDFELDDINVFRANRLPGLDRVEGGVRGAYGMRWSAYPYRGGTLSAQVAQGWRAHADSTFGPSSGFTENLSDYVARVDFTPTGNIAFTDRIRLDRQSLGTQRNEASVSAGPPALRGSMSYGYFEKTSPDASTVLPRRHYLTPSLSSALSRNWLVSATASEDLTSGGGLLGWSTRAVYNDECFALIGNLARNNTSDRDYLTGYTITFNVVFKTLGQVPFTALSF